MALSNKERQARWRDRLKAKALTPIETAFREYARDSMSDDWINECEDRDAARNAKDAVLAKSDAEMLGAIDELIGNLWEAEYRRLARSNRRRRSRGGSNETRPPDIS